MGEEPTTVRAGQALLAERSVRALHERMAGKHMPRRPEWDCHTCDQQNPWPCDPARVHLAELYGDNKVSLSMYLASLLDVALVEMPTTPPQELHERFVAWTR